MHLARMGRTFKKQVSVIWSSRMYTPKEFVGANWICVRCVHRTSSWYISGGSEQSMEAQGPFSHLSYREIGSEKNIQKQHDPAKWMTPKKERKKNRKTERNKHSVPPKSPYSFVHFLPKKIDSYPTFNPSWSMDLRSPTMPWEHPRGWSNLHPNTPGCLKAGCPKKINQIKATVHPTWNLQISDILHFQIHKLHVCFAFASQILTCPWKKRYLYHVKGLLTFLVFHTFTFQTIFSKNLCAGSRQSNWPIKKEANLANWL